MMNISLLRRQPIVKDVDTSIWNLTLLFLFRARMRHRISENGHHICFVLMAISIACRCSYDAVNSERPQLLSGGAIKPESTDLGN